MHSAAGATCCGVSVSVSRRKAYLVSCYLILDKSKEKNLIYNMKAVLASKGQIMLPKPLCDRLGLKLDLKHQMQLHQMYVNDLGN